MTRSPSEGPLYATIYEVLREHIDSARLPSGLVLQETSVARAFNTSRMPAATFCSCVRSVRVCVRSHESLLSWQLAQPTPSATRRSSPRSVVGTFAAGAWQAVQLGLVVTSAIPSASPIRAERGVASVPKDRACGSSRVNLATVPCNSPAPPWQPLVAQDALPRIFAMTAASPASSAAPATPPAKQTKKSGTSLLSGLRMGINFAYIAPRGTA